jgi:hypothetical protein
MGLFDRLIGKKNTTPAPASTTEPAAMPATATADPALAPATPPPAPEPLAPTAVLPRLAAARERLEAQDLPGALAIYEPVLAAAGERADVLVTISGDLGTHGHVAEIIELIAPRYDGERHGPATGLNVLQAYLALRNPDAAQHVLDILFALHRPELEESLFGFSNAIADLMEERKRGLLAPPPEGSAAGIAVARIALITVSKPIWVYGLESLAAEILPPKADRLRRIAFAPLALPGYPGLEEAMKKPEDELGRLSRALPFWFAETLYFCPHYAPVAVVALLDDKINGNRQALFGAEWTVDNIRQLVDSAKEGFDFVVTGSLSQEAGDYELVLRLWEVKKYRERKQFEARWSPATADTALTQLHAEVRQFMECTPYPAGAGLAYAPPAAPRAWLDTLGVSLGLFLAEKKLLPTTQLPPLAPEFDRLAPHAADSVTASLAWLTLRARVAHLDLAPAPADVPLAADPLIERAQQIP